MEKPYQAKKMSLKYWSRLKVSGNEVVGYCLENPNQFLLLPEMFQKGAELKFISLNIGLGSNFRETKLLQISQINI